MVRVKYRYFIVEFILTDHLNQVIDELPFERKNIYGELKDVISRTFGDYGSAIVTSGLLVKMFSKLARMAYVRCSRASYRMLGSVLPFIRSINGYPCFLRTVHVAGSIRSCHKFLKRHTTMTLIHMMAQCSTLEGKLKVKKSLQKSLHSSKKDMSN